MIEDLKKKVKRLIEEYNRKFHTVESRLIVIERFIVKAREERKKREKELKTQEKEVEERAVGYNSRYNRYSSVTDVRSIRSRGSSMSGMSRASDSLTLREVNMLKQMMLDKEKESRKNNIVIKGWDRKDQVGTDQVEQFLKDKLGVEVKVLRC